MIMSFENNHSRDRSATCSSPKRNSASASARLSPRADHVKVNPMNRSDLNPAPNRARVWIASLLLSVSALGLPATPALAQGVVQSTGAAERIDITERVRALSQRIGVAACHVQAGSDVENFKKVATDAIAEFDRLMLGLAEGNPELGLPAKEEERKVLAGIRGVDLQWQTFAGQAKTLLDGSAPADGWDYVARQNLNLMHSTKYLVQEIINAYANPPELLQSHALTLDIVGRQRSLALQMAKEACGLANGNKVVGNSFRFAKTVRLFEASLNALANGFPAAGVITPPTPEIAAKMAEIQADWAAVKPDVEAAVTGVDPAASVELYKKLDAITTKFDEVTLMYVTASKSGI
ncbi:hypothetical protein GCM10007315_10050 [Gemmobacter tilapiae]|uniref:NarX-like N-terminal domain-containing protein n=2 Tax=Neogemmobacter tilapiae TaxID=875041 RepID=A0A918THS3_9RHOB|nr:hypothetical protein GCM10007315_10050 [Gemmobacter tilapiae]